MENVGEQREAPAVSDWVAARKFTFTINDDDMAGRGIVPGMYGLCAPIEDIRPNGPVPGDIVLVERHRGDQVQTTLREVRSIRNGLRLESCPASGNPLVRNIKDGLDDTGAEVRTPYILIEAFLRIYSDDLSPDV